MSTPNMSFAGLMSLLAMTGKVRVVGNKNLEDKPVITPMLDDNNNPKVDNNGNPLGSIRLEQDVREYTGSFVNARTRVAFVGGTIEELTKIATMAKLADGKELGGKIVIVESLKPMYKNHQPKINPNTGETIEVAHAGKNYPVYMQMRYVEDANAPDVLIRDEAAVASWLLANEMTAAVEAPKAETAGVPGN